MLLDEEPREYLELVATVYYEPEAVKVVFMYSVLTRLADACAGRWGVAEPHRVLQGCGCNGGPPARTGPAARQRPVEGLRWLSMSVY